MIDASKLPPEEIRDLRRQLRELPEVFDARLKLGELAALHGLSASTVRQRLKAQGSPNRKPGRPPTPCPEALNWDWSRRDVELASEHRCDMALVAYWRKRLKKPRQARMKKLRPPATPTLPKTDWNSVDWTLCDSELGRLNGISRERVRQLRPKFSSIKTDFFGRKYVQFLERAAGRKSLSRTPEFADIGHVSFITYCRRAGIHRVWSEHPARKHPWKLMDFRLQNIVLAGIWGIPANLIAMRRYLQGHASALLRDDPLVKGIIEQQERAAGEWRAAK